MDRWSKYYLNICEAVAQNSRCLSRQIGAILVKDKSIIATGYNGPPRGVPHCGIARYERDPELRQLVVEQNKSVTPSDLAFRCPRRLLGYESGAGLQFCIAAHAERNCIANAARMGVCTKGATLCLNACIPCKDCLCELINAGIIMIVCKEKTYYDDTSRFLVEESGIVVASFDDSPFKSVPRLKR